MGSDQLTYKYPELVKQHVAIDIGPGMDPPPALWEGVQVFYPMYQQNNINAYHDQDDQLMDYNLYVEIGMLAPCTACP